MTIFARSLTKIFTRPSLYINEAPLTAGFMKRSIFWDITPCSRLKASRRFGRTRRPHLQDLTSKPSKNPI
jgi:hypothetical protein